MARSSQSEYKAFAEFAKAVTGEKITATDWKNLREDVRADDLTAPADDWSARRSVDEFAAAIFIEYGYCCWQNWGEENQYFDANCCDCCPSEPVGTPQHWDAARIAFDLAVFDGGVHLKAPVTCGDLAVVDRLSRDGLHDVLVTVREVARIEKAAKADDK